MKVGELQHGVSFPNTPSRTRKTKLPFEAMKSVGHAVVVSDTSRANVYSMVNRANKRFDATFKVFPQEDGTWLVGRVA